MSAISKTEDGYSEKIIDDLSDQINDDKLQELKNKLKHKQGEEKMAAKIIGKKAVSLSFGIVGSGQGGSRLAESFFNVGYDKTVVVNTAIQDLKHINIPDQNKLLLEHSIGGSAKSRSTGSDAAANNIGQIKQLINEKLDGSQINILCTSLGGGSGSGSIDTMIQVLTEIGKPIIVMGIMPMSSEDAKLKSNAIEALVELSGMVKSNKIANLILIDNARIEAIYHDVSQMEFFNVANKAIVEPLDALNMLTQMSSFSKPMDPLEFSKLLLDGNGLSVYGNFEIKNPGENTVAISEAIINNMSCNLLVSGHNLKECKYAGFVLVANKKTWDTIPAANINYANAIVDDFCGSPNEIYKGLYEVSDIPDNIMKVYSFFSGLGLPMERVDQLKAESKELQDKIKNKEEGRNLTLHIDGNTTKTMSNVDQIKAKIAAKSSTFGKFVGGGVADRRK
jgi:cell division GTPase FtsZ